MRGHSLPLMPLPVSGCSAAHRCWGTSSGKALERRQSVKWMDAVLIRGKAARGGLKCEEVLDMYFLLWTYYLLWMLTTKRISWSDIFCGSEYFVLYDIYGG